MTDKHGRRIVPTNCLGDLVDVAVKIDTTVRGLVAQPRKSEGLDLMAFTRECIADCVERPGSVPTARH